MLGLRSPEDRERKRMLERFEKYGLKEAATDFGQVWLLFTRTRLGDYDFSIAREDRLARITPWCSRSRSAAAGC